MTEPLKPRIDFDGPLEIDQNPKFRAQQTFDENQAQNFAPATLDEAQEEEGQVEAVMDAALRPKRSLWRKMVMGGLALFGASVVGQGVQWTMNAWQTQDWVALGGCAAGALIIGAGVGSVVTEWRRLWRLRQRAHERDEARDLLHSHGTGKGRAFCEKLAQQAGIDQSHPALQRWYASIHETQNDREVVSLYAHLVQPVLDAQARREISRSAAESTLMIAVSPLALVDMAFIAWRNLRLINRIATLYGIELGYYSRLRLFKLVLLNIAFAGASELVREVGMDWMSQDLAARLSTRAAQGIGAGLLTARLGIILDNLRWGSENASEEECIRVAKLACADEFIERFPDKYNTWIEQGGSNVSGGQKQRLTIARALLRKPKVLILDDSTSAVDTATDAKIRKAFREEIPGTTKIIIAQRISSVQDADRILVLDNGQINGLGTHEELLKNNAIYQEVYNSQTQGGGDFDKQGGEQ